MQPDPDDIRRSLREASNACYEARHAFMQSDARLDPHIQETLKQLIESVGLLGRATSGLALLAIPSDPAATD